MKAKQKVTCEPYEPLWILYQWGVSRNPGGRSLWDIIRVIPVTQEPVETVDWVAELPPLAVTPAEMERLYNLERHLT